MDEHEYRKNVGKCIWIGACGWVYRISDVGFTILSILSRFRIIWEQNIKSTHFFVSILSHLPQAYIAQGVSHWWQTLYMISEEKDKVSSWKAEQRFNWKRETNLVERLGVDSPPDSYQSQPLAALLRPALGRWWWSRRRRCWRRRTERRRRKRCRRWNAQFCTRGLVPGPRRLTTSSLEGSCKQKSFINKKKPFKNGKRENLRDPALTGLHRK